MFWTSLNEVISIIYIIIIIIIIAVIIIINFIIMATIIVTKMLKGPSILVWNFVT